MMRQVKIDQKTIRIGKKRIPLLSGEVHYWRLNPKVWPQILDRVREMGIEIVSAYVPWDYHEYRRGKFDFLGRTDPARNLKGFLELTQKKKFWLVIRPGPYIYSEWPNEGVPAYAHRCHRLHPQFLKDAVVYLRHVVKVIRPFLATRAKGPILLLQADNEIDPWPDRFGAQYGLNGKPGLFQEFLKERYEGNLGRLNASWGTSYRSFQEAFPLIAAVTGDPRGPALQGEKELKRNLDYLRFKHAYSLRYARWVVKQYRDLGIDVPIYLNLYPFFYAHDWRAMESAADCVGIDLYPTNEFSEDEFEHRKVTDKVRYLRNLSPLPFIAEFGSGVWHNRIRESGIYTPNHYRLLVLSALLGGITGWNWYMLVNRDNWYLSPIDEWGRPRRELFDVFKNLVHIFRRMDPPALKKLSAVGVTYHPMQHAARTFDSKNPLLTALDRADVDYEVYDPRDPISPRPSYASNAPREGRGSRPQVLFYSGGPWLEGEAHQSLRRYVEGGGTLVAFRDFPRKDEAFERSSELGFEEPQAALFEFRSQFEIQLASGRRRVPILSSVDCFEACEGEEVKALLGSYGRRTVGYLKKIGRGKLIHFGFEPTREFVSELLDFLRVPLDAVSETPEVKTGLFTRGPRTRYLVVVHNGNEAKNALIRLPFLQGKGKWKILELVTNQSVGARRASPLKTENEPYLTINLPPKDGRVFEFRKL